MPAVENAKKFYGALLEDPLTQSEKGDSMDARQYLCHIGLFDFTKIRGKQVSQNRNFQNLKTVNLMSIVCCF